MAKQKKVGRPKSDDPRTPVTLAIPKSLRIRIDEIAANTGRSRSEVVVEILSQRL